MGFFKQMKDMKEAVAAAPGLIEQSQQMANSAQINQAQMMAQQQAVMAQAQAHQQAAAGNLQAQPGGLDAIAGVSLQQYAVLRGGDRGGWEGQRQAGAEAGVPRELLRGVRHWAGWA